MASKKAAARALADLAVQHGARDAVICHGSRNAPLILSLNRKEELNCYPLADERSAAFFALGLAQNSGRPVIVNCSSGTAALNMAPAVAEAYYQRIPLVIVTADRPDEWIDQMDGQTIRQKDVFHPHIRRSVQLPLDDDDPDTRWYGERSINEAFVASSHPIPGPVHINIPFREPLYGTVDERTTERAWAFFTLPTESKPTNQALKTLEREWEGAQKVMVLAGSDAPSERKDEQLELLTREKGVPVLAENLSNLRSPSVIRNIDRSLKLVPEEGADEYAPDLLITIGGAVVSKLIKAFLRKHHPTYIWRVDPYGEAIDTYQGLSRILPFEPETLFEQILAWPSSEDRKGFRDRWKEVDEKARGSHREQLQGTPWSDLLAFERILNRIPEGSELHAGNSSPVRYLQLPEGRTDLLHRGNRGTSGIDGVLSTAAGAAVHQKSPVTVITGDIGFFYDSNALWNPALPENLRIILINNGGGGIFRIIDGPSSTEELAPFFEGGHELNGKGISESFGLPYYFCRDPEGLSEGLEWLYATERKSASVLEVKTPREENDRILKEYFNVLERQKPSS